MPWPGITIGVALYLFAICYSPPSTQAEENVGCLFSERLCLEDEWCYDDMAFGRCLKPMGDVDEDDLFRYELEREGLHELSSELRRLFALGYRWSHGYTQCRLQAMLYAFKNDLTFEPDSCARLSDNDLEGALKALEGQVDLDPSEVAIIKYTPSEDDPHAAFADEVYYPPVNSNREQEEMRQKILAPNAIELDIPDPYADYTIRKRAWIPQRRWVAARPYHFEARKRNVRPDALEFLQKYDNEIPSEDFRRRNRLLSLDEMIEMYPEVKWLSDLNLTPAEIEMLVSPENYEKLSMLLQRFDQELAKGTYDVEAILKQQLDAEKELENLQKVDSDDFPEMIDDYLKNRMDDSKSTIPLETNIFGNKKLRHLDVDRKFLDRLGDENEESDSTDNDGKPKFYAEGGVVWTDLEGDKDDDSERILENNLDKLFGKYNKGFKRPERLDVKKPGPPFDAQISDTAKQPIAEKREDSPILTVMKKNPYRLTDEEYDDSYVHVEFKHGIKSWKQGDNILKTISHVLNIQPEMLSHQIYKPYSMSFKVEQNSRGWNSSELARRIAEINTILKEFEGVDVVSVAFGDEQNLHSIVMYPTEVKQNSSEIRPPLMKKEPRGVHPHNTEYEPPKSDEMDHIYVEFANDLKNWKQGSNIITNITNLLRLERWDLSEGKVRSNYVSFKVNSRVLNAKEVAKGIKMNQERLEELTGVQITSIGIGNKESIQSVISEPLSNDNEMYIVVFMICGILASVIITTALLFFIRKHIKSRDKLHSLTRTDPEISKDVVKTKAMVVAKPGDTVHGRITSLSRESEQSPSSRSSTSSWSEEPVFHNMDISTGHMVLSYMEDHLKNKDRLEQEWVALCAYVAEPCETSMAKKKDNVDKNRYPDIVPYDHARIVLNELSNASGSDYINASSITDHDPRNPAYIATQGPLPHSTPDFWQLIWEQGAVVIVMLTRLTEGGAAMCHRYWPEEGSEVYHIYEVHLVSEHIWCDDYLVRSFYLKNIRTGETRTVTQFHFLSWPESGVPTSTKALLEFRRKVNKSYRGRSCPIVVHCSDGSGRTGTYCLIDMVLSRMAKGAKEIDIAATLEHLRDQRPKMVASKPQFEFVLTAVAEEVHAILKALPPQTTPVQEKEK